MEEQVGTLGRSQMYALFADRIKSTVRRICGPRSDEFDDRMQTAWTELMQYASDNKAMTVANFIPCAMKRIRGAVIDDIRNDDPRTRTQRVSAAKIAAAAHAVTGRTKQPPRARELAEELGMSVGELHSMLDCLHRDVVIYSSEAIEEEGIEGFTESALDTFILQESVESLLRALMRLPERDLEVIKLRYFEGLKNREIARKLNIGDSRATELHNRGIERLRKDLLLA